MKEAWNAAVKAAHGEVYGVLNPRHRGINATLADAKKYFEKDLSEFDYDFIFPWGASSDRR